MTTQNILAHSLTDKIRTRDVLTEDNISFNTLLLSSNVLNGLKDNGFESPSPIQLKAIPLGRCGIDLVVKSKSGTGKTLVFSVICLEMINPAKNKPQALILTPTREIAIQIQDVIRAIGNRINNFHIETFIGGLPVAEDTEKCKSCHIAVGTPGRIKYLIDKKLLDTDSIRLFVLDEADKLMEDSFKNDINSIYNKLPERKQMITTSATYPNELNNILSNYMISPTHITAELDTPLLLGLLQFVSPIPTHSNVVQQMQAKTNCLIDILTNVSFTQCLVFSNYQTRAESISNTLNQKGWNSTFISAAKSQPERINAVNQLKEFKCRVLLSTDLAARGIDAANVDLVINYDIPIEASTYLHRMGRAGRYGATGICINIVEEGAELRKLQIILGSIVGENFKIPKLTNLQDLNERDLSVIDCSSLEFINTILPSNHEEVLKVKKEVFELKCNSKGKSKVKQQTETVQNVLNKTECELNKLSEELNISDTKSILLSMAEGNIKPNTNKDSETILVSREIIDDNGKRKRINLQSPSDNARGKIKADDRTTTYYKNKTLLSVSKLLIDGGKSIGEEEISATEAFLQLQTDNEANEILEQNVSTKEMLKNFEQFLKPDLECNEKAEKVIFKKDNEDIFHVAYNYATKPNAEHWKTCLSDSEWSQFEKFKYLKLNGLDSSENEDDDEDYFEEYDEEEEEEVTEAIGDASGINVDSSSDFMKWVPVEKGNNEASNSNESKPTYYFDSNLEIEKYENRDVSNLSGSRSRLCNTDYERFSSYYEQSNESLWQTGLSFDNVSAFDEWFFNNWQTQLYSIRNFIQQNIYVNEMSKVQINRKS